MISTPTPSRAAFTDSPLSPARPTTPSGLVIEHLDAPADSVVLFTVCARTRPDAAPTAVRSAA
ncbi:hypothetical protein [Streptomyces sp. NPDC058486]|uniref:hypothetical protein n=1 Tax=unclassified Streptomyces TaxID=2593676 RepID=UPI0036573956